MKKGFTLSEVLITLVVIGVVAAITIPTVLGDWQKERTLTALKKTYSTFSNAMELAILKEGPFDTWNIKTHVTGAWSFAEKYILPYVSTSKNCKIDTNEGCEFKFKYIDLSRRNSGELNAGYFRFMTLDGVLVAIKIEEYTKDGVEKLRPSLIVDINGSAPPNMYGRDIFMFEYYDDGASGKFVAYNEPNLTREQTYTSGDSACNRQSKGEYCAALIMKDNWHLSKNYPW